MDFFINIANVINVEVIEVINVEVIEVIEVFINIAFAAYITFMELKLLVIH